MPDGEARVRSTGDETWQINLNLHPAQQEIYDSPARFKIIAAGRRFGKTMLGASLAITEAVAKPDAEVWWVSPSHKQSREAMRWIGKQLPKEHREVNVTQGEIYLSSGGRISFRSAERWDNLRGIGLDFVVIDEAAFVDQRVWTQVLRPTLLERLGRAFLISTFDGENWFYDTWRAASQPNDHGWQAFEFHTSANPFVPADEIEDARRHMPREEFEQEFECSPISFKGAVFDGHKISAAVARGYEFKGFPKGYPMMMGVDWGWQVSAAEVCGETEDGSIAFVHEEVLEKWGLDEKVAKIAELCKQFNVQVVFGDAADPTSNYALAQTLSRLGLRAYVQPVPFNAYKIPGIRTRAMYLEQDREIITAACPGLLADSRAYKIDPITDKPAKGQDHTVDAATAFYASKIDHLGEILGDHEDLLKEPA